MIFSSNEVVAPGVVENLSPDRNRLLIGECDDRAASGSRICAPHSTTRRSNRRRWREIREAIWSKLLTNMSMSVLCLFTGQTARGVRDDPAFAEVIPRMLEEARDRPSFIPRSSAFAHRPCARSQAVAAAGLRARPRHGDRRAGEGAGAFARAAGLSTPTLDLLAASRSSRHATRGFIRVDAGRRDPSDIPRGQLFAAVRIGYIHQMMTGRLARPGR